MRDGHARGAGRAYAPTIGMLRALTDAHGATSLDYVRCRLRGLTDLEDMPTAAGRDVIAYEGKRRRGEVR